ncbi:MAG TPA: fibronectin type III domain-containing protein [Steroidobacteraceae bacterium]|nr:fibronectin type III domain-containing protein [Steroidobacteraceae bacterium]
MSNSAVTLNWTPPTENTNGSALTNLAGYDIHYGTASGDYTQTISVSNAGIATYVVDDLTPGTYYFAVAAVNSQGTESPPSPEVSATVN